jgi:hypothetical protein
MKLHYRKFSGPAPVSWIKRVPKATDDGNRTSDAENRKEMRIEQIICYSPTVGLVVSETYVPVENKSAPAMYDKMGFCHTKWSLIF